MFHLVLVTRRWTTPKVTVADNTTVPTKSASKFYSCWSIDKGRKGPTHLLFELLLHQLCTCKTCVFHALAENLNVDSHILCIHSIFSRCHFVVSKIPSQSWLTSQLKLQVIKAITFVPLTKLGFFARLMPTTSEHYVYFIL